MSARAHIDARSGKWVIDVGYGRGKRKRIVVDGDGAELTARTAVPLAKSIAKKVDAGEWEKQKGAATGGESRDTVRAFANAWLARLARKRKAGSNAFYRQNLDNWIFPILGDRAVASIDRDTCEDFAIGLLVRKSAATGRPPAWKTRNGILRTLSVVLSAAVKKRILATNPAFRLSEYTKNPDEIRNEIRAWTRAEALRALDACRRVAPRWYPFLALSLRAGPRVGETAELRWSDFDTPRVMTIARAWNRRPREDYAIDGGGVRTTARDGKAGHVTTPKSGKPRLVDLTPHVLATLAAHKAAERARAFRAGRKLDENDLVFTGPKGARLGPTLQEDVLDPIIAAAGVPRITPHGLRHTFATLLIADGKPIQEVSQQLGHANIETTLRHYAHAIPRQAEPAAYSLDDAADVVPSLTGDGRKSIASRRNETQKVTTRLQRDYNGAKTAQKAIAANG